LKLHPHAHGNMRTDRLHVWHMKVLLYAVFNDQKVTRLPSVRSRFVERETRSRRIPSKLSSTGFHAARVPPHRRSRTHVLDARFVRSLLDAEHDRHENSSPIDSGRWRKRSLNDRAVALSSALAIIGRRTPERTASSVVDLRMYAVAMPATGDPTACTP
jgi:hypothetical protein